MSYPFIQDAPYHDPLEVFAHFSEQNNVVFFDSAEIREHCGRYSFIASSPFLILKSKNGEVVVNGHKALGNPWKILLTHLRQFSSLPHPDGPPFQGGAAGLFSYDLFQYLEPIQRKAHDEMQFPDMAIGFYDTVLAFDVLLKRAWIISNGYPLQGKEREPSALKKIEGLQQVLNKIKKMAPVSETKISAQSISANFSSETYQKAVQKTVSYILAGDIFEANISQRYKTDRPKNITPFDLYRRLRLNAPTPFAGFARFDTTVIVSQSPERFLKLSKNIVEARPIKGTRPRGATREEDERLAHELLQSEKDHAENIMIVDLLRNDLSRVCRDHSVIVPQLCGLESYATVHHLVSIVRGEIVRPFHAVDLLCASFPGGSITGAPKKRSIEIIDEIEPTTRGPYCGSLGYIGFNGDMDTSILIRSFALQNEVITFQVGGAIVLDSSPLAEYEETLTKAKALLNALIL